MTDKIEALCNAMEAELSLANQTRAAWPNAKAHMLRQQMVSEFRNAAEQSQKPWAFALIAALVTAALMYWGLEFKGNRAALWASELVRLAAIGGAFWVGLKVGREIVFQDIQKKYRAFIDF